MNLFDIQLQAGVEAPTTMEGRYFRILNGEGRIWLSASNGKSSQIIPGVGVDLGPFEWFRLRSDEAQTVTVLVSDLPTTDSRLSGNIFTRELATGTLQGQAPFAMDGTAQTIPGNIERSRIILVASLSNTGTVWLGTDTAGHGIPLTPGAVYEANLAGPLAVIGTNGDSLHVGEQV